MNDSLIDRMLQGGGIVDGSTSSVVHFGDPAAELQALLRTCAVADRSCAGRVRATGSDFLDLLNRLGTGDTRSVTPGAGLSTVLTTAKGRIVERLFVHRTSVTEVLCIGSPASGPHILDHFRRHTIREKTGLIDLSEQTRQLAVIGPRAADALCGAGFGVPEPLHSVEHTIDSRRVLVLGSDDLTSDHFSVVVPAEAAGVVWQALVLAVARCDGRPAGAEPVEAHRILLGLPLGGFELTEAANPLEAGLQESVSFDKGCYVGQEVIARLDTYDKVVRAPVGLILPPGTPPPDAGRPVFDEDREIGRVTSSCHPPGWSHAVALARVRRAKAEPGTPVLVGEAGARTSARIAALPFER